MSQPHRIISCWEFWVDCAPTDKVRRKSHGIFHFILVTGHWWNRRQVRSGHHILIFCQVYVCVMQPIDTACYCFPLLICSHVNRDCLQCNDSSKWTLGWIRGEWQQNIVIYLRACYPSRGGALPYQDLQWTGNSNTTALFICLNKTPIGGGLWESLSQRERDFYIYLFIHPGIVCVGAF